MRHLSACSLARSLARSRSLLSLRNTLQCAQTLLRTSRTRNMGIFTVYNKKSPRTEPRSAGKRSLLQDDDSADSSLFMPMADGTACLLCGEQPKAPAVASCYHQFCHGCILDACAKGLSQCPDCCTTIREVRPLVADVDPDPRYTKTISLPPGTHAGLTLEKREGAPGCLVSAVVECDQAFKCGVREGDVILTIDGEVICDPADGTRAIDAARGQDCECITGRAILTIIPASVKD